MAPFKISIEELLPFKKSNLDLDLNDECRVVRLKIKDLRLVLQHFDYT